MVALYIFLLSLFTLNSSVTETLGSEGMEILDDILAEISSMRSDIANLSSMMENRTDKLLRQMEDLPKKTPPQLPPQPSICHGYTELNESWRHIDYVNRGQFSLHCDKTGRHNYFTNLAVGWYRFTGAAGTKLPTAPAPGGPPTDRWERMCGTNNVGYIASGGNPTIQDGIVTRYVCFEYPSYPCARPTKVKVAACRDVHGEYLVYQLQPVRQCYNAYCALDD